MQWSELFNDGHEPSDKQIKEFVDTPLWGDLANYLQRAYNTEPKVVYSSCSMDKGLWKGWNVKYKKSGKSLCTLYPKQGYFLSLITVSEQDVAEADIVISLCCDYMKDLYASTPLGKNYGKMLGVAVTSEEILRDVKNLIALRVGPKTKG